MAAVRFIFESNWTELNTTKFEIIFNKIQQGWATRDPHITEARENILDLYGGRLSWYLLKY